MIFVRITPKMPAGMYVSQRLQRMWLYWHEKCVSFSVKVPKNVPRTILDDLHLHTFSSLLIKTQKETKD